MVASLTFGYWVVLGIKGSYAKYNFFGIDNPKFCINLLNSLAKDPARTAATDVSLVGTCAFAVGAGCVLAASAGVVGASDILEQTTGLDPAQRGAENALMGLGLMRKHQGKLLP